MTPNIFFASDFHAYHKNICRGTSAWSDLEGKTRNFNTIEEMNSAIIKSINSRVQADDILYHLGDWAFGGWENIWNFRKQIVCKNIINIDGNHDDHIRKDKFFPFLEKQDGVIYEIESNRIWKGYKQEEDVTAKDFFKETHNLLYLEFDKQKIILSHEPFEIWRDKDKGAIHLYGHVHHGLDKSELSTKHKRKDVGWNGQIYSLDEVLEDMKDRDVNFHH